MKLGIVQKMKIIFETLFSSFLSIELILLFLLLLVLLIINLKRKNKIIPFVLSGIFLILIVLFGVFFNSYTITCVDSFIMKIMDYYYFPSTVIYFFIFLFMGGVFIFSLFSKKLKNCKKIFNYICSFSVFLFFAIFVAFASIHKIDLADTVMLYKNDQILAIIQVSNFIVLFWFLVSVFYHLYQYFKKKFDENKEKVEN